MVTDFFFCLSLSLLLHSPRCRLRNSQERYWYRLDGRHEARAYHEEVIGLIGHYESVNNLIFFLLFFSIIPVVMAGIIAIYGLVVAVLIAQGCKFFYIYLCISVTDMTTSNLS